LPLNPDFPGPNERAGCFIAVESYSIVNALIDFVVLIRFSRRVNNCSGVKVPGGES